MTKSAASAVKAEQGLKDLTENIGVIAERGREFYETSLRNWGDEAHSFVEQMAKDGAEAFEKLQTCQSPMDAFAIEQAWLMARSKAYMEAGQRMVETGFRSVQEAAEKATAFRLPD